MRVVRQQRPVVRGARGEIALETAPAISRIEDEGDGTPARVFNALGVEVRPPSRARLSGLSPGEPGALRAFGLPEQASEGPGEAPPPVSGAGHALRGLVHAAKDREGRREAIARRLGKAVERVRGLDRHVHVGGDETRETLVDPVAEVPVEVIVTRDGTPVERTHYVYDRAAGGALVRRAVRSERLLPGAAGDRLVIDVEFSDLRVEVGGAR